LNEHETQNVKPVWYVKPLWWNGIWYNICRILCDL